MDPSVRAEVAVHVRMGFHSRDELVAIFCEEMYEPGELDEVEVARAIDEEVSKVRAEQKAWPAVTDCDRLDRAFAALNSAGIVSLQNAGLTQDDGYDDVLRAHEEARDRDRHVGYCYYHGQDLERAVRGGGLYLSFGPLDPEKEEAEGPRIGKRITAAFEKEGLKVRWNGTFGERILVPDLVWRKRL